MNESAKARFGFLRLSLVLAGGLLILLAPLAYSVGLSGSKHLSGGKLLLAAAGGVLVIVGLLGRRVIGW